MTETTASDRRYARHRSTLTGLGMVLHAAQAAGLPAPSIVASQANTLHLDNADEFAAWEKWLDGRSMEITTSKHVQHYASGEKFGVEVNVVWLDPVHTETTLECVQPGSLQ